MNELTEMFNEMKKDMKDLSKEVQDLSRIIAAIDAKLDAFNRIQEMAYLHEKKLAEIEIKLEKAEEEIDDLKSTQTWLWRTIGGFLIVAILGFFFMK